MVILSLDLSLSCPAFAVIKPLNNNKIEILHLSHIKTKSNKNHGFRLFEIYVHMSNILKKYPVNQIVRERGFSRFATTTQALFKVVGISDLCSFKHGFDTVSEVTPTTVKKLVTGNGKATKEEVAINTLKYIDTNINTNIKFKTDDESDAVAVGIAYLKQKKVLK